ncbi:kinase [Photobacterium jeanii]|uniref:Kinase n=1 Tax=Photobacterium jeanii TaxID=858640 RepID=A0A178K1S1_9GAMM|nr:GTPase [Photobacterium jeanii]OAN11279.1 kinase [Photobacterium jeanii]PST90799.1 DUF697 domain-containing protein [Photobacterium jeanii]
MEFFEKVKSWLNPSQDPDLTPAFDHQASHLPTLWLLGKTGAGKSSLVHSITQQSDVEIGDGFQPCTQTSHHYDFPQSMPLLRFLDTRGLAEANYDASEDIAACQDCANALIVVMKAEEPEQSQVLAAIRQIKKSKAISQILVVHTGVMLCESREVRQQCIAHNQQQVETAWGEAVTSVDVDFECADGSQYGVDVLQAELAKLLPIITQFNLDAEHESQEERNFAKLRTEILWYAGAAGGSDAVPAVGLVSVPAIQAKMIHSLANRYGVEWDKQAMGEFMATLGTSFGVQYAAKLGIRQLVKLVPVYGQTVGSATAAVVSFCTTFALGRVACYYLYHESKGESVSEQDLNAMYKAAFESIKEVAKSETNSQ